MTIEPPATPWPRPRRDRHHRRSPTGSSPSDIAVLTRVNSLLAPVQVALGVAGIATQWGVGAEFADRAAVRGSLAWLRLATVEWGTVAGRCRRGVAQPVAAAAAERRRLGGRAGFGRRVAPAGRTAQHATRSRAGRGVRRRYRAAAAAGERRCHDLGASCRTTARFDGHGLDPVDPRHPSTRG